MPKPKIGQGDNGKAFLFGSGQKFLKSSIQFEALGSLDELTSHIGFARSLCEDKKIDNFLEGVQKNILIILANIGTEKGYEKDDRIPRLQQKDIDDLLFYIKQYEESLPVLNVFILPSGTQFASYIHICRSFTRRAERKCVLLKEKKEFDELILKYINRLSDVFFALARYINYSKGIEDNKNT